MVKPEPKFYRIAFATCKDIVKKQVVEPKKQTSSNTVETKFANKYDKIIAMAIQKNMLEESDKDIKMIELQSLSESEFDNYVKEVESASAVNVSSVKEDVAEDENLTEAEKALRKIKQTGPILGDFSDMDAPTTADISFDGGSEKRSLSDIRQQRMIDNAGASMDSDSIEGGLSLGLEQLKNSMEVSKQKKASLANSPMKNIQGLKKPIVVVDDSLNKNNSLQDLFGNMKWSMGKR